MPNIVIRIPQGVLNANAKSLLVSEINAVAAAVEQIPDNSRNRFLCWVIIEEISTGNWTCGGADATHGFIPVLAEIHLPAGVLDEAARRRYVAGFHQAIAKALPDERRQLLSSCIFNEVAPGLWGINGGIWDLKDFAKHAGFKHLQHFVDATEMAT